MIVWRRNNALPPRIYEGGALKGQGESETSSPSQKSEIFASPLLKAGAEAPAAR